MNQFGYKFVGTVLSVFLLLASCGGQRELTEEEILIQQQQDNPLLAKTQVKMGGKPYEIGTYGGTWVGSISNDPKTFNTLNARDGDSGDVLESLFQPLLDYDPFERKWIPNLADWKVETHEDGTMDVIFTLRDDVYWTNLADDTKVQVTADDVVFWYNEIDGDPEMNLPGYPGQFVALEDGTEVRVTIEKLSLLSFKLRFPRVDAYPELSSNMEFGPRYIYEPVKKAQGVEGVFNLFSVDTDPRSIPSIGPFYLDSYTPGVGVKLTRNPHYWKKDAAGNRLPYLDGLELKIIPNTDTEKLTFLAGGKDGLSVRPEDLEELVNKEPRDYTVYNAGPSLGAAFVSWNQNPKNLAPKYLKWFSNTKFRQAMSSAFNRDRVVDQVYRGLAKPALHIFSTINPYFDPNIQQKYTYDLERAKALLAEIGIVPNAKGLMEDEDGDEIVFDMVVGAENSMGVDIVNIYSDELRKIGVTMNVKPIDFQKLVEMIIKSYDWHSVIVSLGSNSFPIQGSNVWQSKGNFHLWNPLQAEPATDWEAHVDTLYQKGARTLDPVEAKKVWDEFQTILLDQLPLMYIVHGYSFQAYRNKWGNLFVDNLRGSELDRLYLLKE